MTSSSRSDPATRGRAPQTGPTSPHTRPTSPYNGPTSPNTGPDHSGTGPAARDHSAPARAFARPPAPSRPRSRRPLSRHGAHPPTRPRAGTRQAAAGARAPARSRDLRPGDVFAPAAASRRLHWSPHVCGDVGRPRYHGVSAPAFSRPSRSSCASFTALRRVADPHATRASQLAESPHRHARRRRRVRAHRMGNLSVTETMTGAQLLVRALEEAGVDVLFGLPGGMILPAYDPLLDSTRLRHILVRHEQDAGHAAAGYATATGRPGVCMATSGPGATNLVTALADAAMDSVPVVAVTGQVTRGLLGTDAFQEADICGITQGITKHNWLVRAAEDIPGVIARAFHLATTGRPGPVLVDIPKDVLQERAPYVRPARVDLPGVPSTPRPHPRSLEQAASLLRASRRPVLYAGGGIIKADAAPELLRFAELTGVPVVTTLMARGAFPGSHRQHLGMPGMHGTVAAVAALQHADLVLAVGARFDDRVTGDPTTFARHAKIVHADIDAAEIGKNRAVDVPIVGDAKDVLAALTQAVRGLEDGAHRTPLDGWWDRLDAWRTAAPLTYRTPPDGSLSPQQVIERIGLLTGPDAVYASGVGQHQMWASHYLPLERPRSFLNSGGLGTMGYALPAAMGAKLALPDTTVWAVDGDGCFQMTCRTLATCAIENIPIKVAVINNAGLGMVRQLQSLFFDDRHFGIDSATRRIPDFAAMGEAYGGVGLRCDRAEDLDATIRKALEIDDAPVVVDFAVSDEEMVWPMIAAGASNDDIRTARASAPIWDTND
ncbi:acetolactate synthase large subunit [Streptomyces griseoviridis]